MKYLFLIFFFTNNVFSNTTFLDSVERMKWKIGQEELDVVWIEDNKFPKFTASIYFHDGALNDSLSGLTQVTFDQMSAGTKAQSQRELSEFFDFYGANLSHSVTHEYSVFTVQALTKDISAVFGKVCELFKEAQYPKDELNAYLSRSKSRLKNLVTSHSSLADRVFRAISLEGTPYGSPVEGTIDSFEKITSSALKGRLMDLNKAKKVIYLAGPSDVKNIEGVISKNCPWSNLSELKSVTIKKAASESSIYLVEVPGANQAQIRIGRYLTASEFDGKESQFHFMSRFFGGGFTSKLVQELRVKRGLTYSAGAYASLQRDYGRAGIITFSKNETAAETISLIREIFSEVSSGKITDKEFNHEKQHQIGGYAFGFEETNAFLAQIMLYDHQKRNLNELANFPNFIEKMKKSELARSSFEVFPWEKLTIVVVGDKSLEKTLSRIRPVRVIKYADYL